MPQDETMLARLLPKEQWSKCPRCESEVPEFEFSQELQLHLFHLIEKRGRVQAIAELRAASSCDLKTAKAWVSHKTYQPPYSGLRVEQFACPHCGKPLRTPQAKQCR